MQGGKLKVVGDLLQYWFVRYVVGPGLLATAALHRSGRAQLASILPGLLIVEGANWVSQRRAQKEGVRRDEAIRAQAVEAAHRRIVEVLIDAVTVFEAHRPADEGRYRANVLLVDGDVLRMAYKTPGYTEGEEALEWHKGQGCAGRAWERGQTTVAPTEDAPLPTVENASAPTRGWGMTTSQVQNTTEIQAVISVPIFSPDDPSQVVAVFNLDDTVPHTDYGQPTFDAAQGVADRVAQQLLITKFAFPQGPGPYRTATGTGL